MNVPVDVGKKMRSRRFLRNEKGSALVEFALILPLLVLLLFGIIEFGLLLYNQQVITNASREGARYGIVSRVPQRRSIAEITQVVNDYCASNMITFGSGTPQTTVNPHSLTASFGEDLTVAVTFDYDFLVVPGFITSLAGGANLRAETTMKYE
jgi:Flp pilus assembly protein TadG